MKYKRNMHRLIMGSNKLWVSPDLIKIIQNLIFIHIPKTG